MIDYKGIVVLILAASLGIVVVSAVLGVLVTGRPLSPHSQELLATILGAMVGVLATYVGIRVSKGEE